MLNYLIIRANKLRDGPRRLGFLSQDGPRHLGFKELTSHTHIYGWRITR